MVASSDLRRSEHRLLRQREGADGNTDRLLPDREHHRELAGEIRRVAQLARFPFARKELVRLAEDFEHRDRNLGRHEE